MPHETRILYAESRPESGHVFRHAEDRAANGICLALRFTHSLVSLTLSPHRTPDPLSQPPQSLARFLEPGRPTLTEDLARKVIGQVCLSLMVLFVDWWFVVGVSQWWGVGSSTR